MNKNIVNIAIAVIALGFNTNAQGQAIKAYAGNTEAAKGQTIVSGTWKVVTDSKKNLIIEDANNTVIRVIAAPDMPLADATQINYPVDLSVDQAGNLHIADNMGAATQQIVAKNDINAQKKNTWTDPDSAEPTRTEPLAATSKPMVQAH